jgi:hypothetical protein
LLETGHGSERVLPLPLLAGEALAWWLLFPARRRLLLARANVPVPAKLTLLPIHVFPQILDEQKLCVCRRQILQRAGQVDNAMAKPSHVVDLLDVTGFGRGGLSLGHVDLTCSTKTTHQRLGY